jgi:hypothetical protein
VCRHRRGLCWKINSKSFLFQLVLFYVSSKLFDTLSYFLKVFSPIHYCLFLDGY